jgi:hypothetical protein
LIPRIASASDVVILLIAVNPTGITPKWNPPIVLTSATVVIDVVEK